MATPSTKPVAPKQQPKKPKYDGAPVSRTRAVRTGHNEYTVIRDIWDCPPTSSVVEVEKVSRVSAEDRCRLAWEHVLGPNRLGGTGLE